MGIVELFLCTMCKEVKEGVLDPYVSSDPVCGDCQKLKDDKKKEEHLAGLQELTLEERVAKLEEDAYDHNLKDHGWRDPLLVGS